MGEKPPYHYHILDIFHQLIITFHKMRRLNFDSNETKYRKIILINIRILNVELLFFAQFSLRGDSLCNFLEGVLNQKGDQNFQIF